MIRVPIATRHDKLLLHPIAMNMMLDWESLCDHNHDRKRVFRLNYDEFLRTSMLIATMLANKLVKYNEGRMKTFVNRDD
jgi:hypothetical protein